MLPVSSLPLDRHERRIVVRYLTAEDHVWLGGLLEECDRYVGRRRSELEVRLTEPLFSQAPADKLRAAIRVLLREYSDRTNSPVPPVTIRRALFDARARCPSADRALCEAAAELGIAPRQVEEYLLADLPSERCIVPLQRSISAAELALKTNHDLVAGLLKQAIVVQIDAEGDVRGLVQAVKLRGLLCTAVPREGERSVRLEVSGPYSLFRHTRVYGRALASLIPRVSRCRRFELRATCVLRGAHDRAELLLRSGDPVIPAEEGKSYDSKVEERFAKEFGRSAPDWEVIREPEAVSVGGHWIFPDFALRHRRQTDRRYIVEIVGFWTREYLERKLSALRAAQLEHFILCIDSARNCATEELPHSAHVIRYRRWVPVDEVIAILEGAK